MSIEKTTPLSGITTRSHHDEPQLTKIKKSGIDSDEKEPICTLSLSGAAEKLLQASNNDICQQRVEEIRQKIECGELTIDAEKIADKLFKLNTTKHD